MFLTKEMLQEALGKTGMKLTSGSFYREGEVSTCAIGVYILYTNPTLSVESLYFGTSLGIEIEDLAREMLGNSCLIAFASGFDGGNATSSMDDEEYGYWLNGQYLRRIFL